MSERTGVCPHCGVPVTLSADGNLAVAIVDPTKLTDATDPLYCRPEDLPGGVADDRVFPLHGWEAADA